MEGLFRDGQPLFFSYICKLMKKLISLIIFCSGMTVMSGQNQLDEQGRKTGPWKVEYPDGKTLYEGSFLEGKPVGQMIRYYETGAIRAKMNFDAGSNRSHTELYYKGGKKAATGIYAGQEKDSVWTYYSEFDGTVRMRETYESGKLHGAAFRYYPSGEISEEVHWQRNSREGPWIQYFEGGGIRLKSNYQDNLLNGPYEVYFREDVLIMSGIYENDRSEGTWSYFDENGDLLYTLEFKNGRPVDEEKYMKLMQDTLLKYDTIEPPQPVQFF